MSCMQWVSERQTIRIESTCMPTRHHPYEAARRTAMANKVDLESAKVAATPGLRRSLRGYEERAALRKKSRKLLARRPARDAERHRGCNSRPGSTRGRA